MCEHEYFQQRKQLQHQSGLFLKISKDNWKIWALKIICEIRIFYSKPNELHFSLSLGFVVTIDIYLVIVLKILVDLIFPLSVFIRDSKHN